MSEQAQRGMTADEFVAWVMVQPEGCRYEMTDGEIVGMASERAGHARAKGEVFMRLREAVRAAKLPCEVFPDGMAVRVSERTVYEPDVQVRCGAPLGDDTVLIEDPIIIVEVLSPSTGNLDAGIKLSDYFRVPSLRHYLIVDAQRRRAVHHQRDEAGTITTKLLGDGPLRLDPPGLVLPSLFSPT
ncbi:MAG: Uma2 family endonuclease [Pseudomonadota bacterium]|nr:Uma2 family endonuclease [Pseudomonadota bacterium]